MFSFFAKSRIFQETDIISQAGLSAYWALPRTFRTRACGLNALLATTQRPFALVIDDMRRIARHNFLSYNFDTGVPETVMQDYLLALGYKRIFKNNIDFPNTLEEFLARYPNSVAFLESYDDSLPAHAFAVRDGIIRDSWPVFKELAFTPGGKKKLVLVAIYYLHKPTNNSPPRPIQLLGRRGCAPEEKAHIDAIETIERKIPRQGQARRQFMNTLITQLAKYKKMPLAHPYFEHFMNAKISECYLCLKDYPQAVRYAHCALAVGRKAKTLNQHPVVSEVHYLLGLSYFKLNDYLRADRHISKALAVVISPGNLALKLLVLLNLQREDEIIALADKCLEKTVKNFSLDQQDFNTIYFSLGLAYEIKGQGLEALKIYDKMLARYPHQANIIELRRKLLADKELFV